MAEFEDGNRRVIVAGYPREWLTELAADLSTRVGASLSATTAPAVIVQDPRENPPELADAPRPAETTVKINSRPGGILIEIPPAGFRGFSRSLLTFAIVWCAIVALMGGMALFGKNRGSGFVGFIPFGLIGVGLIAFAQNLARRRTTFLVEGGRLKATQSGPFGTREREWQRNEIAAIRADASGMEVNERPVIDLQVHPIIGKKVGYLASRDENELRWIATELRRALNVPATTEPRTVPGDSFSKPKL
jgi:hypothetical protein